MNLSELMLRLQTIEQRLETSEKRQTELELAQRQTCASLVRMCNDMTATLDRMRSKKP